MYIHLSMFSSTGELVFVEEGREDVGYLVGGKVVFRRPAFILGSDRISSLFVAKRRRREDQRGEEGWDGEV